MLWSKQYYYYDVDRWLEEHGGRSVARRREPAPRNSDWFHMVNGDVISMPDKWEYPWYAAWDLAFHCVPLAHGRPRLRQAAARADAHGALPAPERADPGLRVELQRRQPAGPRLGHLFVYQHEKRTDRRGRPRLPRRAPSRSCCSTSPGGSTARTRRGRNVFEGGFLGLDNIGVFDRSAPLPTGGYLEQADGTAWMAFFSPEHARDRARARAPRPALRGHGRQVRRALPLDRRGDGPHRRATPTRCGTRRTASSTTCCACPTAAPTRLKVRSMVGLLPLCAATVMPAGCAASGIPELRDRRPLRSWRATPS